MPNRIRIFLGAYINQINAQNLNCRAIAQYIDHTKFEVYALTIHHGNLGKVDFPGVRLYTCYYPVKLTQFFGFLWGISKSDVAYLPRGNDFKLQRFLTKVFNRKCFKTVENVIDEESLSSALAVAGSFKKAKEIYSFTTKTFSITQFMREYNEERHQLMTSERILPLLIDTELFKKRRSLRLCLSNVVFIGNDMKRKRVEDFIRLADCFLNLSFHIVGRDNTYLRHELSKREIRNIKFHGLLNHTELLKLLKSVELHILPSRSEGFPRGILECAALGIPSIVYHDYGASEWINTWENGVVCSEFEEMEKAIQYLLEKPQKLEHLSQGAMELAEQYSVERIVKLYEEVIEDLAHE